MTRKANFSVYHIRKWFLQIEDNLANESGKAADGDPVRKIVIAACLENPFAGKYVKDLSAATKNSDKLGHEFGRRILKVAKPEDIMAYGKACLVGVNGEYEHGNAHLTTTFMNPIREALGGSKSWVPSTGKRGSVGAVIDIPFGHRQALYVRANYDTITCQFADAPGPNELVLAVAFATRGRLHARLGGLQHADAVGEDGLK